MRNSYVYIYGLRDPRDGKIKYVGQTENMKTRLAMHIAECSVPGKRASRKMKWISELLADGFIPEMITLEIATTKTCAKAETKWIKAEEQLGELFNVYKGGSRRGVGRSNRWTVEFEMTDAPWIKMFAAQCGLTVPEYLRQLALSDIAARKAIPNAA